MQLYKEELLDHYRFPRHRGRLIQADFRSRQHNPSCGDQVCFDVKMYNGLIAQITFEGAGCVISQASASMIAVLVKDKPLEFCINLTHADVMNLIGMELGPTRLKCALLALYALQEGAQVFMAKKG